MTAASNATHINCFVNESAFGSKGSSIQKRIEYLLEKNGPEWVVDRGKAIYNAAQNLRAGDKTSAIKIYQSNSIAYTKQGYPKDEFNLPVKVYVESTKRSQVKKAAGVLRFYTAHTLRDPSLRQIAKSIKTISSPPDYPIKDGVANLNEVRKSFVKTVRDMGLKDFALGKTQRMSARHLNGFTATHSIDSNVPKDMLNIPYMNVVNSMSSSPHLPLLLQEITPSMEMREAAERRNEELGLPTDICGRIHIIQEGGCKPRVVAIPNSWIQLAFTPVHDVTSEMAKTKLAPWSCMHDQNKGIIQVQKQLQKGLNVSSVDLSAATDRFPIELQTDLLSEIGMDRWAKSMDEIAKGKWEFPQGDTQLSYATGQPMGMYGSFPVFHCTHIILAKTIERVVVDLYSEIGAGDIQRFDDGTAFKVLGDDIVFSDKNFAGTYKIAMESLGVEISESKTFIDKPFSEFAGYTATRDVKTNQVMVFKPYKQPKDDFISNPVQFMETFNRPPKQTKRWEQIFKSYSQSRSDRRLDLTPAFPEPDHSGTGQTRELVLGSVESAAQTLYTYHSDRYTFESGKSFLELVVQDTIVDENPILYGMGFPQQNRTEARKETFTAKYEPVKRAQQDPLIAKNLVIMKELEAIFSSERQESGTMQIGRGADAPLNPLEEKVVVQALNDLVQCQGSLGITDFVSVANITKTGDYRVSDFNQVADIMSEHNIPFKTPEHVSISHSEEFLASVGFKDNPRLTTSSDVNSSDKVVTLASDSPTPVTVTEEVVLKDNGVTEDIPSFDVAPKGRFKDRIIDPDPDYDWDLDR